MGFFNEDAARQHSAQMEATKAAKDVSSRSSDHRFCLVDDGTHEVSHKLLLVSICDNVTILKSIHEYVLVKKHPVRRNSYVSALNKLPTCAGIEQ